MKEIAIVSAVRTAITKGSKGAFKDTRPDTLAAWVIKEAVARAKIQASEIEDISLGCAMPEAEQGMNVARIASLLAGLPNTVAAVTVNRFCASGLEAAASIAKSIACGQIKVGIAGGVESMSMVPMGGHRPSANPELFESMPQAYVPMGITAENVAKQFGISRADQDEFSYNSHKKALFAQSSGFFDDEIIPVNTWVFDEKNQKQKVCVNRDEGPRADTNLEALAKLKPAFSVKGTVTAGNASQVSDGAAALVMMDADIARAAKLPILGYFRSFACAGVPPEIMGIGPVPAITKLLANNALNTSQISVFEINEAFAAQAVYCVRELGLNPELVNPCGGAVALGHPLGCTGSRQITTILRELKRQKGRYGVTAMCVGGGMGAAGLIELAI